MSERTLILAGSYSEAARYARGKQLRHYRYAVDARAAQGFQATEIVELPGYESRRDQFAIASAIKGLLRRGIEVRKDSYEPPPTPPGPQYGEAGYKADMLFGDLTEQDLRSVGATDGEVKMFVGIKETAERLHDLVEKTNDDLDDVREGLTEVIEEQTGVIQNINDVQDEQAAEETAIRLENKVSGRGQKSSPKATNRPKTKTSDVDDLFED
jgi:hypothetical protein